MLTRLTPLPLRMILYYTIPIDTIHSYDKTGNCMLTRRTPLPGENFRQGWTLSSSWIAKYFRCDFL